MTWPRPLVLLLLLTLLGAASPSASSAQQIVLEKAWEVGSPWGPDEAIWKQIRDAKVVGNRVFVVDVSLSEGRVFDTDGRYLKELGSGEGKGPSEFLRPSTITHTRGGAAVYDFALDRRVHFDSLGTHVETLRLDAPGTLGLQRVWEGRDGWWIGWTGLIGRRTPEGSVSDHLVLAWNSESAVDTLTRIPGNPFWMKRTYQEPLQMHTTEGLGASGGAWVIGDSLLVLIDGNASAAQFYDLTAGGPRLRGTRSLPGSTSPVTPADRVAAKRYYMQKHSINPDSTTLEDVVIRGSFPAWSEVIGGSSRSGFGAGAGRF